MKKYVLKYRMSETTQPKVDALFAALKAAENEEIELIDADQYAAERMERMANRSAVKSTEGVS